MISKSKEGDSKVGLGNTYSSKIDYFLELLVSYEREAVSYERLERKREKNQRDEMFKGDILAGRTWGKDR